MWLSILIICISLSHYLTMQPFVVQSILLALCGPLLFGLKVQQYSFWNVMLHTHHSQWIATRPTMHSGRLIGMQAIVLCLHRVLWGVLNTAIPPPNRSHVSFKSTILLRHGGFLQANNICSRKICSRVKWPFRSLPKNLSSPKVFQHQLFLQIKNATNQIQHLQYPHP